MCQRAHLRFVRFPQIPSMLSGRTQRNVARRGAGLRWGLAAVLVAS